MLKKVFGLAAVGAASLSLAACGGDDVIKIGLLVSDPTEGQQSKINEYLKSIEGDFGVEFLISEKITDAATERSTIENWAVAGVEGMISFVDQMDLEAKSNLIKSEGIYNVQFGAPSETQQAGFADNPYYLGGIGQQRREEEAGYQMAKALLDDLTSENRDVTVFVAAGGEQMGVEMFVDRVAGIKRAIAEWETATGYKVGYSEVQGFPNMPGYVSSVGTELAKKPDIVLATMSGELFVGQISNIGGGYDPLVGVIGSLNNALPGMVSSGAIDYLAAINPEVAGMSFALLYNYVTGYTDFVASDDIPVAIDIDYSILRNAEDVTEITSEHLYTVDDIKSVTKKYNKDATYESFLVMVERAA